MKEQKCRPLRRWLLGTVTNKFRDVVGRVTPCAPFGKLSADRGAHGVTRPTRALHDVTKLICRGTREVTVRLLRNGVVADVRRRLSSASGDSGSSRRRLGWNLGIVSELLTLALVVPR